MNMKDFLKTSSKEQRQQLASQVGSTVAYFQQIAGGHRKPGAKLCRLIQQESKGKIKAKDLRPDYFI